MNKRLLVICGLLLGWNTLHAEMTSIGGWHAIGSDPADFVDDSPAVPAEMMTLESGTVLPEMTVTDLIRSQSAALNNDPVKIFEFVRNRIGYELYYGCFKGAEGTLLSGYGNDVDQCTLLGALLKAADDSIEVAYIKGNVVYSGEFLTNLTGCPTNRLPNLNPWFLMNAPVQRTDGWEFKDHYWLQADIDGTVYQLDPAFVRHEAAPDDAEAVLTEVTGYTRTNLLNIASNGATVFTAEQVQNVNGTAVENLLCGYVAEIRQAQKEGRSDVEHLVGQRQVQQQIVSALSTSLPPDMIRVASSSVQSSLPDTMFARYELTHPSGFSAVAVKGYDLAGKRLTLFYAQGDGNRPVLRLDGAEIARGTANLTQGQVYNLTIKVVLPAAWGNYEKRGINTLTVGYSYNVVSDLLTASPKILALQSRKLTEYRAQGLSDSSEKVLGTTLHLMGLFYCRQNTLQGKLLSRITGIPALELYQAGVVAQEAGYYIDLPLCGLSYVMEMPNASSWFLSSSFFASGLEHGMLEQIMGSAHPGISTTKGIALNNAAGKHTYYATTNNWTTGLNVRSKLTGYTTAQKSTLDGYISGGYKLLVPRNTVSVGEWDGVTFFGIHPQNLAAIISGDYGTQNGGFSGYRGYVPPPVVNTVTRTTYIPPPPPPVQLYRPLSIEPVDLYSGDYLFEHTDLMLSGPLPLVLSRHYNSGQTSAENVMGPGWGHSLQIEIDEHSSGDFAFGERDTADAAAVLTAQMITLDLMRNEDNAKGWTTAAIAAKWAMDSAVENTLTVRIGNSGRQFTRLPNGAFNAPPGSTDELIQTNGVYVLRERNANTYTFTTNNRIARIADPDGNTLTFTYNAKTNVSTVISSFGPSLTFSYTGGTQLVSVADNSSLIRTISYQYSSSGNLTNFTDAAGKKWGVFYQNTNHPNAITSLKDPEGIITIQNRYSPLGTVTQQVSATSNLWNFYTSDAQSIEEDPAGRQTVYRFDAEGRTVETERTDGSCTQSGYDGYGRLTNTVSPAGITNRFVYDNNHNLLEKREAVDAPEEATTAYGYDAQHHLRFVTNAVSTSEQTVTEITYTDTHHIDTITEAKGTADERITDFNYYPNGLLQQKTEGNGLRVTGYTYDNHGNPDAVTSTDAGAIDVLYDIRGSLREVEIDGVTTEYFYDERGLLTNTAYAVGTPDQISESRTYWDNGLLKTVTDARNKTTQYFWTPAYKPAGVVYPDTGSTTNLYDEADRLTHTRDAEQHWTEFQLDALGRITNTVGEITTVSAQYDPAGNVTNSAVDPSGLNLWSVTAYDALNRPFSQQTAIAGQQFFYDSLSRLTNRVDAASKPWAIEYDDLGRVRKAFRPSENYEEYDYDALGSRTYFWNAERKPMTFGVDAQGRVISITNAIGKDTSFIYDDKGNLTDRRNSKNELTHYDYNALNRLTNVVHEGAWKASFAYDGNGNIVTQASPLALSSFSYDSMNRLMVSTTLCASVTSVVENSYDLNGNRTNIVYPGGLNVSYSYDDENRLNGITAKYTNDTRVFSFGYDGASRLTNIVYPNNVVSTFSYDAENRVTNYAHGAFISRSITRDPRGFKMNEDIIAGLEPSFPEGEQRMDHNDADQLNKITQRDTWLGGELNQWYNRDYGYDDNGCLTQEYVSRELWNTNSAIDEYRAEYTWDYDNRLTGSEKTVLIPHDEIDGMTGAVIDRTYTDGPSISTEYIYDASGIRIGRVHNAVTNYFVVDYADPLKRPLCETDPSGNVTCYYVWAGFRLLAHIEVSGSVRYYHSDELGSTLAITDESGAVTDEFAYSPYGKQVGRTGITQTPFQWLGGYGVYFDSSANLHLTLHRAYSADMRRWLSADPLGIDGFENLYVYGDVNPVNFIDPTGEVAWVGAIGGGIGGFASDILLQAGMNMLAGNEWNEDLDWGSAWTSAGVGAVAGATGMGAITQGKNAVKSFKVFNQARKNVNAREIAIAAGKFRNPTKTAMQISQRNQALKQVGSSIGRGAVFPTAKSIIKEAKSLHDSPPIQPTTKLNK